ncbi:MULTISPECIES: peptidylprolyl isomerase [unclassified Oceanobacter]|jgi:peptidyl-prolyl cis-trans isomerase SurA|uniref:peptidylprolyl isomerase n=1 Tax=unclassified Oceanobacter TaxID=2620260 RepID=UPI0026E46EE2|nr:MULTISPECIES: peptidylprolyl isomerase [unclassified Oceanobacter]MDO6681933.1 peptidylprolyl isomerase [Oceanobacter sp. 5_MG-2023]MDP2505295.1 peptidylprolyl isomerase [Oceanobacter sp. 3_MG-2023]MDP2609874.1 peptidylprolyl isomerase [Oceanobacter sp. 1_MG-2023]MDP2612248.1 peptidylprolyl isomerase [Oceanobacter sp. 2_MG-2023]
MTINKLIFLFFLTLGSTLSQAQPVLIDHVVAIVDDDVIMASQLQQRIQNVRNQNRGANLPEDAVLGKQVLDRLIEESIQLQLAKRIGIRISDAQLNDSLQRIAAQNKMNLEQFRVAMEAEGIPFATARAQIETEMITSRLQRIRVGETIQITDQDVDYFLASEVGKMASAAEYRLGHILVSIPADANASDLQKAELKARSLASRIRGGANFSDVAIADSDGRNALKGGDLGWRKEGQLPGIFAPVVPDLAIGDVSDPIRSSSGYHLVAVLEKRGGNSQMITQYQVRHILVSPNELRSESDTETLINQLYQRLQQGQDFAVLAKEFSDDPGSGAAGGDLGWVSPGAMVPEFDTTMQQSQVGHISAPFETQFGWHILQVQDQRQSDIGKEMQRNQVRQLLYSRRFEEELPLWLRKIRTEAYVDIKEPA